MRMAKADKNDFKQMRDLDQACEALMDDRPWRSIGYHEEDEEYKEMQSIREGIAEMERITESSVDERIVAFEFIKRRYNRITGFMRVNMGCEILINNVCDPSVDYLDYHPGFDFLHVAPEQ